MSLNTINDNDVDGEHCLSPEISKPNRYSSMSSSTRTLTTTRTTKTNHQRHPTMCLSNWNTFHINYHYFYSHSSLTLSFTNRALNALLTNIIYLILISSTIITYVHCEEECLRSKVWCYECESINDPYCSDPFNISFDMSLMKLCEGCCVKIVLEKNTPQKNIWRTCTSRLQINLFMVDHVCMEESGGQGHMCFCESDGCNGSIGLHGNISNQQPLKMAIWFTILLLINEYLVYSSTLSSIMLIIQKTILSSFWIGIQSFKSTSSKNLKSNIVQSTTTITRARTIQTWALWPLLLISLLAFFISSISMMIMIVIVIVLICCCCMFPCSLVSGSSYSFM